MKIKDIEAGKIFNIENTPTYPKLKLKEGYVDMRDEILNRNPGLFEAEIMTDEAVNEQFEKYGMNPENVQTLIKKLNDRFL